MQGTNRSGQTAGTLILIGLILQIIEVVVLLFVSFLVVVFLALGVIGLLWVILVWVYSYKRTRDGDYAQARTPTLVFGILTLLTFGIISGILYIVAYVKLGDAMETQSPGYAWGSAPAPPTFGGGRTCPQCGTANSASAAFCSRCGARF